MAKSVLRRAEDSSYLRRQHVREPLGSVSIQVERIAEQLRTLEFVEKMLIDQKNVWSQD